MGKATILGSGARGLGRGQYRVRIEKANNRTAYEILRIDNELAAISSSLSDLYSSYSDARKAHDNARSDLSQIIQQSKESPAVDYSDKLSSATQSELDASISHSVARNRYQSARLKQRSLEGKKSYLNDRTTEDIRTVWCADCQRNLSGSVATIEIPNTDDTILIRPGGADGSGSVYSSTRDGQLRSVHAMSPAEAAWNYTMFPAWQKWKPLYRMGKILERIPNNSKCTVLLDAYSTAQGLDTDVERRLTNVPMTYKGRDDGGPYQVGDRVVVEFYNQNPEAPRVVGFEDYPCTTTTTTATATTTTLPLEFILKLTRADGSAIDETWFTGEVLPDNIVVEFRNSSMDEIEMSRSYDETTGYFTFTFPEDHEADPNGYWITSYDEGDAWFPVIGYTGFYKSFTTVLPDAYKPSQQYKEEDLLQPGTYEFDIPYWDAEFYATPEFSVQDIHISGSSSITTPTTLSGRRVWSSAPWEYYYIIRSVVSGYYRTNRQWEYRPVGPLEDPYSCCRKITSTPLPSDWEQDIPTSITTNAAIAAGALSRILGHSDAPPDFYDVDGPLSGSLEPVDGVLYTATGTSVITDYTYSAESCTGCDLIGPIPYEFISHYFDNMWFGVVIARYPWKDDYESPVW
jgi:hypothetical protein